MLCYKLSRIELNFVLALVGAGVVQVFFAGDGVVDHPSHLINLSASLDILDAFIQGVKDIAACHNNLISLSDNTPSLTQDFLSCCSLSNVILALI